MSGKKRLEKEPEEEDKVNELEEGSELEDGDSKGSEIEDAPTDKGNGGSKWWLWGAVLIVTAIVIVAGIYYAYNQSPAPRRALKLATTTSVYDSGLLDRILPDFESKYPVDVQVISVGSGQALALGQSGDADALFVHSPADEMAFMNGFYGTSRKTILWNTFLVVGPTSNPAILNSSDTGKTAFQKINSTGSLFTSRGDASGTNKKELIIWKSAGVNQTQLDATTWYKSLGQGMGETLITTNQMGAYTLTDEATWYNMEGNLASLKIHVDNDTALLNYYSVITVNQTMHPNINGADAVSFYNWLSSTETLSLVTNYTINGHQVFRIYNN